MESIEGIQGNGHSEAPALERNLVRIGEVSRLTSTKPFVLRYWETEFPMLQPVKSPKGHRLYRREDIETVFTIKHLLYDEGFTIAGARRHLRDQALGQAPGLAGADASAESASPNESAGNETARNNRSAGETEGSNGEASAPHRRASPDLAMLNRKTLLDLRDSLRSLLTALESE